VGRFALPLGPLLEDAKMLRRQPKADDVFHVLHARSLHLSRAVVRNFLWALENIEESFGSIDFGRDLASSLRGSQLPTPLWSPASRPKPLAPLATPDALKSAMEEGKERGTQWRKVKKFHSDKP
jgi:hypothetical protein